MSKKTRSEIKAECRRLLDEYLEAEHAVYCQSMDLDRNEESRRILDEREAKLSHFLQDNGRLAIQRKHFAYWGCGDKIVTLEIDFSV
jgi:hypothetical protein